MPASRSWRRTCLGPHLHHHHLRSRVQLQPFAAASLFSTTTATTRAAAARPPSSAAARQRPNHRRSSPPPTTTKGDNHDRRPPATATTSTVASAGSPHRPEKRPSPMEVQQMVQRIKQSSGAVFGEEVDKLVARLKRTRQFHRSAADLHVFSGLLKVLDKAHQPDKALHYFAQIERGGLTPNTHCFSALISALGTAGRVDDAVRHFAQMARLGVVPNLHCFSALISGFAEAGRVDEAEQWFDKITTVGRLTPDLVSYNALIKANQVAARPEKAVELLQEMTRKGVRPNVVSYSTVISSLANARGCSRREMERAQEVFDHMVQQGVRPTTTTFGALIHGHAAMGDLETARRRVQEMRTKLGLSPDVEIHNSLMDAEQRMATDHVAAYHQVLRDVDHMKQAGVQPDHATMSIVIDAAGFAGLPHEAERHFDAMASLHGLHPNANNFTSLIEALARNGQLDKAEAVLDSLAARRATSALKHDRLTAKSFTTLLGFCIDAGDAARGQRVVAKMHQAGVEPDDITHAKLRDLAKLCARHGGPQEGGGEQK